MSQLILDNFKKRIDLTQTEEQLILARLTHQTYKAKTILVKPGDDAHFTFFVLKGILRSYTVDQNGVEHILNFATPGWWLADMYSYLGEKPAIMNIDVVEDCEVLILNREDCEELYVEVPKLERFFRILTQNSLIAHQQRVLDKLALTAEERYEMFVQKFSEVVHCLPQKHIASYIGVTPEFFSKMKSKLLRKK
ncbi:MAG TPA: Crp/Fnr family transcriptional regulator [Flavobacterium sp.]|nr:Crp/Fnr family transcriptional regulator [Flavobacterium sp.]